MAPIALRDSHKLMLMGGGLIFTACILIALYVWLREWPLFWCAGLGALVGVAFLIFGIGKAAQEAPH